MRVIIIGNGPVKHKLGFAVDEFDFVIRINRFKAGYEEYIGSKTNIICIGNPIKPDPKHNCPVWACFPAHSFHDLVKEAKALYGYRLIHPDVSVIHDLQKKLGYWYPSRFSTTGLTAIELATVIFKPLLPVYTLGFTLNFKDGHIGDKNAYRKYDWKNSCHDLDIERKYYDQLIHDGKVIELSENI